MVLIQVQKTKVNSVTVFDGLCIRLIGHMIFHYRHVMLILVSFYGSVFLGCFLGWRIRPFFAYGFHTLRVTTIETMFSHVAQGFPDILHQSTVKFVGIRKQIDIILNDSCYYEDELSSSLIVKVKAGYVVLKIFGFGHAGARNFYESYNIGAAVLLATQ